MRLLFAIKGLVIAGGGAERVFVELINELSQRGHSIDVVTFDQPGQELFYDIAPNITVHLLGAGEPGISTPRSNMPKIMRGVRSLARTLKPDAAVAFMHSTYVPVAFGLFGTGVPVILSEHTAGAHFVGRGFEKALTRLVQKFSFAKTVVSPIIRAEHGESFRNNLVVMPNPVDLETFGRAQHLTPKKQVLCVGGLRVEKDQATLIAAFEQIADEFPEWTLRLAGEGVTRPGLEAQIARSPVAKRIELPGIVRDVAREYAQAAIVAMPSRYEALPMVAIEGMASGRPVIGFSDCAGAAALIENGVNGLLISPEPDRVKNLAGALRRLVANDAERLELAASAPATIQQYSLDAVVSRWEALLEAAKTADSASLRALVTS
ncbi:glycosyltransferase [Pontixanthobacter aestiaquae]|uniref:Glycosyltransferase n=1 Tax=Pontixanthobacter aestiaquae TaxID=1509367 RepID=A0A844Z4P4_9SPHN|nr:glycosyltransferase [Pontixanthobacter aestiaquae]MDN3646952.1 glycosyltransferase [Pontixanthobacter aestiaquae]MXO82067.1 glycosyltransferase [Pontixanthobacter aestiaquae]